MSTLVRKNKLHLYQAFDTPSAKPEMQQYIGEYGTAEGATDILEGKFDSNNFDNLPAVCYWVKTTCTEWQ
eukprot:15324539-Ditylum_brightwellii.AAC.4